MVCLGHQLQKFFLFLLKFVSGQTMPYKLKWREYHLLYQIELCSTVAEMKHCLFIIHMLS